MGIVAFLINGGPGGILTLDLWDANQPRKLFSHFLAIPVNALGDDHYPCWIFQRRATWAVVLPWARPISVNIGLVKIPS